MEECCKSIRTPIIMGALYLACAFSSISVAEVGAGVSFDSAFPIWPAGRETEKNLFVGFRVVFDCPSQQEQQLRIAASSL